MKTKLILTILFCILAESIIAYPLTVVLVLIISMFMEEDAATLAVISGVLLDFLSIRLLGSSGLFFLIILYLGTRYRKKIYAKTYIYRYLYMVLSYGIYTFIFYKSLFNLTYFLISIPVLGIILFIAQRIFPDAGSKKRLSLNND